MVLHQQLSHVVLNSRQAGLFSISQGHLEAAEEIEIMLEVTDSGVLWHCPHLLQLMWFMGLVPYIPKQNNRDDRTYYTEHKLKAIVGA